MTDCYFQPWLMRDWKLESLANGKEISAIPFRTEKTGVPLKVVHNFRTEIFGKLPYHSISNRNFRISGHMVSTHSLHFAGTLERSLFACNRTMPSGPECSKAFLRRLKFPRMPHAISFITKM